jgi:O-antigen ligase
MAFSFEMQEGHRRPDTILFGALLALLVWLPIPLGSDRPWSWAILEVTSFALLAMWIVLWSMRRVSVSTVARLSWPAIVVLAIWLVYQAIYILPLPPGLVSFLSPEAYRMHSLVTAIGIAQDTMTLSVDPHSALVSLFKSMAYGSVFLLVLLTVNRRSRATLLARTLVYASVIMATYGVFLHVSGVTQHLYGMELTHSDSAIGTYVNRNHFAGYLEMTLALGIGLLIAGLSDRTAKSWKQFAAHTIDWILSPKMVLRLALCVLVIALTTTHSRMGNTAFFSSLVVAGGIGLLLSRHATRNTVILLVSLIAIDLFIVGSWFGVEKLTKRLQETTAGDVEIREEPAQYALNLVRDYPVFGSGPGSFYVTFPRYRPASVVGYYDQAHNDYIQFACESGIVGLAIIGTFVVLTLSAALLAQYRRRDPLMRGMSFACIMGVTALLIHSWVDFNLQIPANATYFMVLCALGWISLNLDRRGGDGMARVRSENDEA